MIFFCISQFLCCMYSVELLNHAFVIACPSMLRERNKNMVSITGFVVLWSFLLVMGGWGWRLCVGKGWEGACYEVL